MLAFNILFCLDYLVLSKDVSGVTACSAVYWAALLAIYPAVLVAVWVAVRMAPSEELRRWHDQRGDGPLPGDPELGGASVVLFATASTVIGLVAGLLGLGGGEFMVPLLLGFGVSPRVAAATSGFVMVFTTSSNLVHYLAAGTMEPFLDYATSCFLIAGAGAAVGLLSRDRCVRQRSHLLVFLVAFILAFSGVLLALRAFVLDSGLDWSFGSFCH
ncbi:unnamed protein product [Prorocentrum cordatum]|uniref:Membrane transporter protein n=1 Tax=Prorocentrum cordatum TaxID=2364126 RepID=A0ABN9SYD3_9DINO|nr:unnamed protein product [Polarella glacialis]